MKMPDIKLPNVSFKRNASLLVIFLTVFIDLVGFGIVLPMLPLYSKEYGASGLLAGCIVASYSLMQFIFAPMWGRLSDRIGRRPVLLISTAGACISYAVFAMACGAHSIWLLMASRIAAGICGANLSVASAYIADISPPEDRSKRMGLIGMAFGLGFIVGPVLGALSAGAFGDTGPGWTAAAICGFNLVLAFFILGESRKPESDPAPPAPRVHQMARVLKRPQLGYLVGVFFLATFCFTCFESTFAVLFAGTKGNPGNYSFQEKVVIPESPGDIVPIDWHAKDGADVRKDDLLATYGDTTSRTKIYAPTSGRVEMPVDRQFIGAGITITLDYTKNFAYWLLGFCGIIGAVVQGGCIGPLVKAVGEKMLIVIGLALVGVSLALLPFCTDSRGLMLLLGGLALFAISSSVYRAPTFGLISLNASSAEQGEVMGVTQSIGSMARIIGPLFALSLMDLRLELPYLICAVIAIIAAVLAWLLLVQPKKSVATGKPVEMDAEVEESKQRINLRETNEKPEESDSEQKAEEKSDNEKPAPTRINLRAKNESAAEEKPAKEDPRDNLKPPVRLKLPGKDEPKETDSAES